MVQYATDVFGEPFKEDAIITEERLSSRAFFEGQEVACFRIPDETEVEELNALAAKESEKEYLRKAASVWFETDELTEDALTDAGRVQLGRQLMAIESFLLVFGVQTYSNRLSRFLLPFRSHINCTLTTECAES